MKNVGEIAAAVLKTVISGQAARQAVDTHVDEHTSPIAVLEDVVQRVRQTQSRDIQQSVTNRLFQSYPNSPVVIELFCDVFAQEVDQLELLSLRRRCVNLSPHNTSAILRLAELLSKNNDLDSAVRVLEAAEDAGLYEEFLQFKLGYFYALKGNHQDAIPMYLRALKKRVTHRSCMNIASSYRHVGRYAESKRYSQRAMLLQPADAGVYYNMANLEREYSHVHDASRLYGRAEVLDPTNFTYKWNYSHALLMEGDFAKGFKKYKERWHYLNFPTRVRYSGITNIINPGTVAGSLFIYIEQGRGDCILFARFLNQLTNAIPTKVEVTVECYEDLLSLFSRSFPKLTFIAYNKELPEGFDFYAPMFEIPRLLNITNVAETAFPYLLANHDIAPRISAPSRPAVGLTWAGNPHFVHDKDRSANLYDLAPLLELPAAQFFSLQKGRDENLIESRFPLVKDLSPELSDFDDTARLMQEMDLVISTCTSTANLAGALGKRGLILVGHAKDWRWMVGPRSDWFPTLRILEKPRTQTWRQFFAIVRDEVRKELEAL